MNLTDEQKQLLQRMVTVYASGCRSPFILIETQDGASLVYSDHPHVPVNAVKTDVMRLGAEGYVDFTINSQGDPSGKPTAAGIALVQRGFADIPVFPSIEADTTSVRRFRNVLASDLDSEESIQRLMTDLFYDSDVETYYFEAAGTADNQFMKAARDRGDIVRVKREKFYYANPQAERDFFHIPEGRYGTFRFDWQQHLVEKGPEYVRINLKVSERKRLELEALHRIQLEHVYREQIQYQENTVDVFLSYASPDQGEADSIYSKIIAAGGTAFLSKKSLEAGDDFAERIREALKAAKEVWLLLSPSSLKSEWVLTEWGAAWVLEKPIIPILHRCGPEDLPQRLSRLHCIDLYRISELVRERFQS